MTERELRDLVDQVRRGELSRRRFVERMLGLGVGVPMAGMMLMQGGVASAQGAASYKPTRRGGGGTLRLLEWQAPTLLNPHFATGTKDLFGSRIFYEPLAQWDAEGNLEPVLAAEIPSRDNGGLAADGRSVVWKIKRGVIWADGEPFSADDVIFNWQYAIEPTAATVTAANYRNLRMEKIDSHTVRVVFTTPSPFWPGQYSQVLLVPRHLFAPFAGAKSRDAPNNNRPVGTGAYTFVEFKPGDLLHAALNPRYHQPNRPHFDALEMKGGGDAASAARAVLQTGEYDYAGSLIIEDEVLKRMEAGGKGRVQLLDASATTAIYLNFADPAHRGRRRARAPRRRATRSSATRACAARSATWSTGARIETLRLRPARRRHRPTTSTSRRAIAAAATRPEFDIAKAAALLDAAGWKPGGRRRARKGRATSCRCCSRLRSARSPRSCRRSSSRRRRRPASSWS